jgi:hypothetical protein
MYVLYDSCIRALSMSSSVDRAPNLNTITNTLTQKRHFEQYNAANSIIYFTSTTGILLTTSTYYYYLLQLMINQEAEFEKLG